jgi:site-specific recombinase XerD
MPTGALRQERTLNHHEENARLLEDFLANLEAANNSPHTIASYRVTVKDFLDFTLGLDMADVTHREISEWLHFLHERGVSANSMGQRLYAIRSFFKFAEMIGAVKSSPARLIPRRKVSHPLPHWLIPAQIQQLLDAADNPRDLALIDFFWATGCRIAEVLSARVENINWSDRSLKVLGKGQKERIVLFGRKTAAVLEYYLEGRCTGPLFLTEEVGKGPRRQQGGVSRGRQGVWRGYWRETDSTGKRAMKSIRLGDYEITTKEQAQAALTRYLEENPVAYSFDSERGIDKRSIRRILRELGVKAGLGRVYPHLIRHSMATAMLEGGADLRSIQELLGHSSITTTQIYTHCATGHLRSELEKAHPAWQEERNEKK